MGEEIIVVIEKDGKLALNVRGSEGPRCLSLTEALEKEMGDILDRRTTAEFYTKAHIALTNITRNPLKPA